MTFCGMDIVHIKTLKRKVSAVIVHFFNIFVLYCYVRTLWLACGVFCLCASKEIWPASADVDNWHI